MRLVTLHQPWASLVALGLKRYETRHWSTDYRGPLLIHAAKRPVKHKEFGAVCLHLSAEQAIALNKHAYWHLGCVVAIADLSNCLEMIRPKACIGRYETPLGQICINHQTRLELSVGDWRDGRYALQLDNVQALPDPIPFTSRQGKLLPVSEELAQSVRSQLELEVKA